MRWFALLLTLVAIPAVLLAQAKSTVKVNRYLQKGDTTKAMAYLQKQINKHPESAQLYLDRARLKMYRGDLDPAMVDLNAFCSLNGTCGEASLLKGQVRYRQGDYAGAIEHYSAYAKQRDDAQSWIFIGLAHMKMGNYQIAANAFDKAAAALPGSFEAWYNGGLAYYLDERYEEARDRFDTALRLKPADDHCLSSLANTLTRLGAYSESIAVCDQMILNHLLLGFAYYHKGLNLYMLDKPEEACVQWKEAMQLDHPGSHVALRDYCP